MLLRKYLFQQDLLRTWVPVSWVSLCSLISTKAFLSCAKYAFKFCLCEVFRPVAVHSLVQSVLRTALCMQALLVKIFSVWHPFCNLFFVRRCFCKLFLFGCWWAGAAVQGGLLCAERGGQVQTGELADMGQLRACSRADAKLPAGRAWCLPGGMLTWHPPHHQPALVI